jgi:long-chain fatty acid transport protein
VRGRGTNRWLSGAALLCLAGTAARGAGFAVDTQGGRATGLGTAVTAHVDDPSAVFYNPAGMLHVEGLRLMAGSTLITPSLQFTSQPSGSTPLLEPGVTTRNQLGVSPPPHVYAVARIQDSLAAGIGVFTNFGDALQWPAGWQGRFKALATSLATFDVNPSVAYRVHPRVRLGAGAQLVVGTVEVVRQIDFGEQEGSVALDGSAFGAGFNAGIQVDAVPDRLSFGLAYRSGVYLPFKGGAHFEAPIEFAEIAADQEIRAGIRTPNTAMAGVAFRPMDGLLVAADVHYYRWRSLQDLTVRFEDPSLDLTLPKRWRDTLNFHLGGEYRLSPRLSVRAGAVDDPAPGSCAGDPPAALCLGGRAPSPTLTPDLPDSNRLKATAGVGLALDRWRFDVGYQFVLVLPARSSAPDYEGLYQGMAHVLGLSVDYQP